MKQHCGASVHWSQFLTNRNCKKSTRDKTYLSEFLISKKINKKHPYSAGETWWSRSSWACLCSSWTSKSEKLSRKNDPEQFHCSSFKKKYSSLLENITFSHPLDTFLIVQVEMRRNRVLWVLRATLWEKDLQEWTHNPYGSRGGKPEEARLLLKLLSFVLSFTLDMARQKKLNAVQTLHTGRICLGLMTAYFNSPCI